MSITLQQQWNNALAKAKLICQVQFEISKRDEHIAILSFNDAEYPRGLLCINSANSQVEMKKYQYESLTYKNIYTPYIEAIGYKTNSPFPLASVLDIHGEIMIPLAYEYIGQIGENIFYGRHRLGMGLVITDLYKGNERLASFENCNIYRSHNFTRLILIAAWNPNLTDKYHGNPLKLWAVYKDSIMYKVIEDVVKINFSGTESCVKEDTCGSVFLEYSSARGKREKVEDSVLIRLFLHPDEALKAGYKLV